MLRISTAFGRPLPNNMRRRFPTETLGDDLVGALPHARRGPSFAKNSPPINGIIRYMIDRVKRLETLFLEEINTLITKLTANGNLGGIVTITAVHVAKDLATAKVYYSVFGSPQDRQKTQDAFALLRKEIGSQLRGRLHLKRIPSFTFEYDDTPEKAARVESIFQIIDKEKHDGK